MRLSRLFRAATPVAWVRWRVMQPLIHYVLGPFKRGVITPTLTRAGDLLEHVPERWRPPVRTRDRVARQRPTEAGPGRPPKPPALPDRPGAGDQ